MTNRIYDMSAGDLKKELIGHTVTNVNAQDSTLTLDNGTILEFEDTQDCCAWFSADLKAGHLTDNAVTAINTTDNNPDAGDYDNESDYTLHILAADKRIADLTITGDAANGYYCHSIVLTIKENK